MGNTQECQVTHPSGGSHHLKYTLLLAKDKDVGGETSVMELTRKNTVNKGELLCRLKSTTSPLVVKAGLLQCGKHPCKWRFSLQM